MGHYWGEEGDFVVLLKVVSIKRMTGNRLICVVYNKVLGRTRDSHGMNDNLAGGLVGGRACCSRDG